MIRAPGRRTTRLLLAAAGTAVAIVVPLVASGWTGPSAGEPAPAPVSARAPTAQAPNTTAPPSPAEPADDFGTEVAALRDADAADPFVVVDRRRPWLFTTNSARGNVPVVTGSRADDLRASDALPELPGWAQPGFTWAPAVTRADGGWVLAFTARDRASGRQCIGVGTSPAVGGPYAALPAPLVCEPDKGGSIDPSFVADETGRRWLLYKDDGNCCGLPTTLHSVPLTATATALAGPAADLLVADRPWEGGLVEAPTMAEVDGRWLLLYSANRWDTEQYAVGAAWCATPAGPCEKQPDPVLTAGPGLDGPGGVELVAGRRAGGAVVTFHAWPEGAVGYDDGSTRRLHIGRVGIDGDAVTIAPRRPGRSQP
jgi:arabinan endo-1,5-alpha-L-arabinosidase